MVKVYAWNTNIVNVIQCTDFNTSTSVRQIDQSDEVTLSGTLTLRHKARSNKEKSGMSKKFS